MHIFSMIIYGRNWQLSSIIEHRRPKHLFCRCIWLTNYMEIISFFWFEGLAIMVLELSMRARCLQEFKNAIVIEKNLNAKSNRASSGTNSFISSFMMFNFFGLRVQLFWISCWSTMRPRCLQEIYSSFRQVWEMVSRMKLPQEYIAPLSNSKERLLATLIDHFSSLDEVNVPKRRCKF